MSLKRQERAENNIRKKYAPAFKAKGVLGALREDKVLTDLASQDEVHPNQIVEWKKHLLAEGHRRPFLKNSSDIVGDLDVFFLNQVRSFSAICFSCLAFPFFIIRYGKGQKHIFLQTP